MKDLRSTITGQILSVIVVLVLVWSACCGSVFAGKKIKPTTKFAHKPIEYYVPEKRIRLETKVTDKSGVSIVRCYFRLLDQEEFLFVEMKTIGKNRFESILPAPSKHTEILEYLFLAVNAQNQVVRTQTFEVYKKDHDEVPAWQQVSSEEQITLSTELTYFTKVPPGFSDSVIIDVVEPSARFGFVVEGLYGTNRSTAVALGYLSGDAATASSAGVALSSEGGISALTVAGIAGSAAAVGVAAGGGGGGDDGGGGKSGAVSSAVTMSDGAFVGIYSGLDPLRSYDEYNALFTFEGGGRGSILEWINGEQQEHGGLSWSFDTKTKVFSFRPDNGPGFSGTVSDITNFTLTGVWKQRGRGTLLLTRQ